MSNSLNRRVSRLKTVEEYLRRQDHFTLYGRECTGANRRFILDLLTLMMWLWSDVSLAEELISPRWVDSLCSTDVGSILDAFKSLDEELISGGDYASFKRKLGGVPSCLAQVLAPLRGNLDLFRKEGVGFKDIRSCLLFTSRGTLPDSDFLEEEALQDWLTRNTGEVRAVDVTPEAAVIRQWLAPYKDLSYSFRPRYGPGHSSDIVGTRLDAKYRAFRYDALLRYIGLHCDHPVEEMPRGCLGLDRCGELRFVPKNLKKRRTITMEPSSLMFYQQGFFHGINERLFHGPLRNRINLERPDLNGDLAWEGSLNGSYATIDLSSASDSVKYWLVRALFDNTKLLHALLATRSRTVRYRSEVFRPNYFAPMGSALCFPVECLVFAAIVESQVKSRPGIHKYRVYGDDIVCPSWAYDQVCTRLQDLGFEVNTDKSFHSNGPGFRESCGYEWYKGEDVTPLRIPRRFTTLEPTGTAVCGLVDLANSAYHYTLLRLRVLKALRGQGILFGDTGEGHVFSVQPTNFHLASRWNEDLQSMQYRHRYPVSDTERWRADEEDIRLYEWLRAHRDREAPVGLVAPSDSLARSTRMKWGWHSPAPGWPEKGVNSSSF